jgi:hypothetical protein
MCIGDEDCDCQLEDDDEFDEEGDEGLDDDEELIDGVGFADPGGRSALRAATIDNPRDRPCPTCGVANRLTRIDEMRHYQCDDCADEDECGF